MTSGTTGIESMLHHRRQHGLDIVNHHMISPLKQRQGPGCCQKTLTGPRGSLPGGPAELLTYNGRSPGPLLEVNAGDRVRLRLRNELRQPTNLHFHGLHIPPPARPTTSS